MTEQALAIQQAYCLICGTRETMPDETQVLLWVRRHEEDCRRIHAGLTRAEFRWSLGNGQDLVLTSFARPIKKGESIYHWDAHGHFFPQMATAPEELPHLDTTRNRRIVPVIGTIYTIEKEKAP